MQEFFADGNSDSTKRSHPSLKLKRDIKDITDEDLKELPYEEMTMKEFLNLPKYRNDGQPLKGESTPPYKFMGRVKKPKNT